MLVVDHGGDALAPRSPGGRRRGAGRRTQPGPGPRRPVRRPAEGEHNGERRRDRRLRNAPGAWMMSFLVCATGAFDQLVARRSCILDQPNVARVRRIWTESDEPPRRIDICFVVIHHLDPRAFVAVDHPDVAPRSTRRSPGRASRRRRQPQFSAADRCWPRTPGSGARPRGRCGRRGSGRSRATHGVVKFAPSSCGAGRSCRGRAGCGRRRETPADRRRPRPPPPSPTLARP